MLDLKTVYENSRTNLIITCPIHGDITILPNNHLNNNRSCKYCNIEMKRKEEYKKFLKNAKLLHNNRYEYNDDYINSKTTINIICPVHGIFPQTPNSHLKGRSCPKCKSNYKLNYLTFEKKANKKHNF